jgi:hypothetical protein
MVGIAQPLCLSAWATDRHRYESTMDLRKRKNHKLSSHYLGWTAIPIHPGITVIEQAVLLTSPFIERPYRKLEIGVPYIPFIRWDEKAGLQRDAIRSQCSTCSRHKEKETGYE